MNIKKSLATSLIAVLFFTSFLYGETYEWIEGDGDLNDAARWSPTDPPRSATSDSRIRMPSVVNFVGEFSTNNLTITGSGNGMARPNGRQTDQLFQVLGDLTISMGRSGWFNFTNGSGEGNRLLTVTVDGVTRIEQGNLRLGNPAVSFQESQAVGVSRFHFKGPVILGNIGRRGTLHVCKTQHPGEIGSLEFSHDESGFFPVSGTSAGTGTPNGWTNEIFVGRIHSEDVARGLIEGAKEGATQPTIGHIMIRGTEDGQFNGDIHDGLLQNQIRVTLSAENQMTQTLNGTNSFTGPLEIFGGSLKLGEFATLNTRDLRFGVADGRHGNLEILNSTFTFMGRLHLVLREVTKESGSWKLVSGSGFGYKTLDLSEITSDFVNLAFVRNGRVWSGATSGKVWTFDETTGTLTVRPGN